MKLPLLPQRTLREYMTEYKQGHTKLGTRLTHMVGIPMIVASFPTALVNLPLAGGLFVGGWALQIAGHTLFEKNKPAFFSDPYYLLVGPVWVTVEWLELFGLPVPEAIQPAPEQHAAETAAETNGARNGEAVASAS
jgi:uncharacterized membrane protein YGL010W